MKTFILITYLLIAIIFSVLWYKTRKKLEAHKRRLDMKRTTKQDLLSLCTLLLGYIFIYLLPLPMTLYLYILISFCIGLIVEIRYYQWLQHDHFPKRFIRQTIFFSAIMFYATVWLGILLLL